MATLGGLLHLAIFSPHEPTARNIVVKFVFCLSPQQYGPLIILMSAVIWALGFKNGNRSVPYAWKSGLGEEK